MNDLISRQAAIDALGEQPDSGDWTDEWECGCRSQWEWDKEAIENVPSAQPQRMRGKWKRFPSDSELYKCSECYAWGEKEYSFCPWCGAKMDGGET